MKRLYSKAPFALVPLLGHEPTPRRSGAEANLCRLALPPYLGGPRGSSQSKSRNLKVSVLM